MEKGVYAFHVSKNIFSYIQKISLLFELAENLYVW